MTLFENIREFWHEPFPKLEKNEIFVFGSNTQGRHSLGSALIARKKYGAIYGQAEGLQGQSYSIVTKDLTKKSHPSRTEEQIIEQIKKLYNFATKHRDLKFYVVYTSTAKNLNAYSPKEMAKMFACVKEIPKNIIFECNFNSLIEQCNHI